MRLPRLHRLLEKGQFDEVCALLAAGGVRDVDERDYMGRTALTVCTNPRAAQQLIDRGADVNARDLEENTPLHYAANGSEEQTENAVRLARLLLEAGAALDARNADGQTPLFSFLFCRDLTFLRELLKRGADPNVRDAEGRTPLANYLEELRGEQSEDPERAYAYIVQLKELGFAE